MAANTVPIFIETPKSWAATINTANTADDGSGSVGTTLINVVTAGADGSLITGIRLQAAGAAGVTTAGRINLYIYDGTNTRLYASVLVPAITPSATTLPFSYDVPLPGPIAYAAGAVVNPSVSLNGLQSNGLVLTAGYVLRASCYKSEAFSVIAFGGDY